MRPLTVLAAIAGVLVICSNGLVSSASAEDRALQLPQRLPTTAPESNVQPVGYTSDAAKHAVALGRRLAGKRTAFLPAARLSRQTGCPCLCPACDHVCHLEAEEVDVEVHLISAVTGQGLPQLLNHIAQVLERHAPCS